MRRAGTTVYLVVLTALVALSGCFQRTPDPGGAVDLSAAFPPAAALKPVTLYRSQAPRLFPRIAAGRDGSLQLAWIESGNGRPRVMTRRLEGDRWQSPSPGVETETAALLTDAAVDGQGRLQVLYLQQNGKTQQVYHTGQTAQGWSPRQNLSLGNLPVIAPRLAVDGRGDLHAAWYSAVEHNAAVFYRRQDGKGWHAGEQVTPRDPLATFWAPSVAVGQDDTIHMVYFTLSARGAAVLYSRKGPDGHWSAAQTLSEGQRFAIAPCIAMDRLGNPHVVWKGGQRNEILYYSTLRAGRWTPPVTIAGRPDSPVDCALAVDKRGIVYLVWREITGRGNQDIFLSRGRDEHWSPPVNVSRSAGTSYAVTATLANETLHLSWAEQAGAEGSHIRWLALDVGSGGG
jgi:hypothetical protein